MCLHPHHPGKIPPLAAPLLLRYPFPPLLYTMVIIEIL
ncbi:hypothetical protein FLA_1294 [Filimonas lacunae]|nr:hypothetical protein FLA_1294 [Filimonas lacunae]